MRAFHLARVRALAHSLSKAAEPMHRQLELILADADEGLGGKGRAGVRDQPVNPGSPLGVQHPSPQGPPVVPAQPGVPVPRSHADTTSLPVSLAGPLDDLSRDMLRRCAQAEAAEKHPGWCISPDAAFGSPHMPWPAKNSPAAVHAWWAGLPENVRKDLLSSEPQKVGAADGIPSAVRDQANRTCLPQLKKQLEQERKRLLDGLQRSDGHRISPPPRVAQINSNLKGIAQVERSLNAHHPGMPRLYLLSIAGVGDGRAVVARGNPDTATDTSVAVPGTTSNLGGFGENIGRGDRLYQASKKAERNGQSPCVITWLGYDAPNNFANATSNSYADNAGQNFNNFVDGLRSAHLGGRDHLTAIGHSYGGTVIGAASREGNLHVDDLVTLGAPSLQAEHAGDLDVPKGHVYAEGSDGPVDNIVRGGGPVALDRPSEPAVDPTTLGFGAHRMRSDADDHSYYWGNSTANPNDPNDAAKHSDSESLKNQARVAMGDYRHVTPPPEPHEPTPPPKW